MRILASVIALALTATMAYGQNATLGPPQSESTSAPGPRPAQKAATKAATAPVSAALAERPNLLPQPTSAPPTGGCDDIFLKYGETVCADASPCLGVSSRWTVRHDFGDGVGYVHGFTYVEGFVPIYQPSDRSMLFANPRVVNFDDDDRWEFNAGFGYRDYYESLDAVLGMNLFYDGRHTDTHFFHQIGVGAEALFGWWEARCNGYFIVGPDRKLAAESFFFYQRGNQLVLDHFQTHDVAMGGLDVEVGGPLPVLDRLAPHAFIGYYHYSAEGMPSANGIRGRLEAWLTSNISLHFAVQHDRIFDTTISGGLAWHFGGSRGQRESGPRSVEERLGQRVVRDVDIVIAQKFDFERFQTTLNDKGPPRAGEDSTGTTGPPPTGSSSGTPSPPPSCPPEACPPKCVPPIWCVPFPGAPGDPATFPGRHFPPGFHHWCFPGKGRPKHIFGTWEDCWLLPRISACRN